MQRIIQIYRESFYGLPKLAWILALALFINRSRSMVLIEMPLIFRLEKQNPVKIISWGAIFFLSGFFILPLGNSFLFALFTVFIFTWGEMLVFPIMTGFIANRASDQTRGRYMGLYTFTFALCYVLGPLGGTWIYENYGTDLLWYGIGVMSVPVLAACICLQYRLRKENSHS